MSIRTRTLRAQPDSHGRVATVSQPRPGARAARHTRLASVPSTADALDLLLEEIRPGRAEFSTHTRVMGRDAGAVFDGGPYATLLDFALGAAVTSSLEVGSRYRVLELRMANVGSREPSEGVVRAVADVLQPGHRRMWACGRVSDSSGVLLAVGSLAVVVEEGDSEH